ncbi:MAG TPA: hypothetical protein VNX88_06260 [Terriglobales bacterium]|nr:hypothetical protein [Terriglobales bacterium]
MATDGISMGFVPLAASAGFVPVLSVRAEAVQDARALPEMETGCSIAVRMMARPA